MTTFFDTMKGRAIVALVILLAASHLLALYVYARMSGDANNLLHDALVARKIATVTALIESLPSADGARILGLVDTPGFHVAEVKERTLKGGLPEGTRRHNFEHLLSAILRRPIDKSIGLAYVPAATSRGLKSTWQLGDDEMSHVPQRAVEEIVANGTVETEIRLRNGSWLRFSVPLLSVSPFSTWVFGAALSVGLLSVLFAATWVMIRWTEPLTAFAQAAERLGGDINAPPLLERGPVEVRTAAQAFNLMQDQLRRLIEDRTQLAAAIAHDLGTPITRLRLRAEEIENEEQRAKFLGDLAQMQRMITATLDFTRQDVALEPVETIDLPLLLQSVRDDFTDMHQNVDLDAPHRSLARLRPHAIRRALTNVIDNAVKYGSRARVRLLEVSEGQVIVVDDDGPGIPESLHGEAFKPFHRLEQPGQSLAEGTGLGLTVAQAIVRDHAGDIALINRPEGGLRVVISLPWNRIIKAA